MSLSDHLTVKISFNYSPSFILNNSSISFGPANQRQKYSDFQYNMVLPDRLTDTRRLCVYVNVQWRGSGSVENVPKISSASLEFTALCRRVTSDQSERSSDCRSPPSQVLTTDTKHFASAPPRLSGHWRMCDDSIGVHCLRLKDVSVTVRAVGVSQSVILRAVGKHREGNVQSVVLTEQRQIF